MPLLLAILGTALAIVIGYWWYRLDGHEIIGLLWPHLSVNAKDIVNMVENKDSLPSLHFDIEPHGFQELAKQRNEALQKGVLQLGDENWIQARIYFQGETILAQMRLKEDWRDRFQEDKLPFQVKLQDGDSAKRGATILGMHSFSLQSPAVGGYLNEWLYMEDLRRSGILAPHSYFVNVFIDDDNWGVYAMQEDITQDLLASQGRKGGVILHIDGSLFWRQRSPPDNHQANDLYPRVSSMASMFELAVSAQSDTPDDNKSSSDPAQRDAALVLLRAFQNRQLLASQVFDAEKVGKYLAHVNLWGARNEFKWYDEWIYYDPSTSKLEPIGYDTFSHSSAHTLPIDLGQYDDLNIMKAYAQEIKRLSQPEYLRQLEAAYAKAFERYYLILAQEFASMNLEAPWSMLPRRQELLLNSLHPPQTVYAHQDETRLGETADIQVCNLLRYPVVLQKVRIGEYEVDIQADWVAPGNASDVLDNLIYQEAMPSIILRRTSGKVPKYVTLHVPIALMNGVTPQATAPYSDTVQIVTSVVGVDEQVVVDVQRSAPPVFSVSSLPTRPSIQEVLEQHPFLQQADQPGFLELKAGTWHIEGDLVLPDQYGLQATQPVTLTFDRDAVLLSNGPLVLHGPDGEGIHFVPKDDDWGGIVVLEADPSVVSSFYNVEIRATSGIQRDGWRVPGGVTFFKSPVVFNRCHLWDSFAQSTIHIIRSDFEFVRTEFGNAAFDALDVDWAHGRVEKCTFYNIREDGIDLSGSHVQVENVNLLHIFGRGISAGESSAAIVENVRAADTYVAMASIDMSSINAQNIRIARAWAVGFAAYREKLGFGASIDVANVMVEDDSIWALVQEESSVTIDGEVIVAKALDIDELYRRQSVLASMHDLNYRLGSDIALIGYKIAKRELNPEDTLTLTLYWHALAELDQDYTIFVHILDPSGQNVVGRDNTPCQNTCPTTDWQVGRLVEDTHLVHLPPDMPAGEYQVTLGMYYAPTGERLPISRPQSDDIPEARIILEQRVTVK
jgi:hypothetical protein